MNRHWTFRFCGAMVATMQLPTVTLLAVATTVVLWGSAFPAITLALRSFTPAQLGVLRLLVAAAALALAAPLLRVRAPAARDLPLLALAGAAGMSGYQLLLNSGQVSVPAGTSSLLIQLSPVVTALLATALLGERMRPLQWAGTAVAFAGAAVLALRGGRVATLEPAALLVLGAALCQATFFIVQKGLLDRYRPIEVITWATWFGALSVLPFGRGTLPALLAAPPEALVAVAALGVGTSAIGFVAWAAAMARLPAGAGANALYLVPCVALAVSWWLLGEVPGPLALAGGVLCVAGVVLVRRGAVSSPAPSVPAAAQSAPTPRPS